MWRRYLCVFVFLAGHGSLCTGASAQTEFNGVTVSLTPDFSWSSVRDKRPEFAGKTHQTTGGLNADIQVGNLIFGASAFRSEARTTLFGNSGLDPVVLSGTTKTSTDGGQVRLLLLSGNFNVGVFGGYSDADLKEARNGNDPFTFSRNVQTTTGGFLAGAQFDLGRNWYARPSLRLQYNHIESGSYITSLGVAVDKEKDNQFTGVLGTDLGVALAFGNVSVFPGIRAAYVRDFEQIKGAVDNDYFDFGGFIYFTRGNFTLGAEASVWAGNEDSDSRSGRVIATVRF